MKQKLKKQNNVEQVPHSQFSKKQFLEKSVIYGDVEATYELGKIHVELGNHIEALRWYVLSFEEHWMKDGDHYSNIVKILKGECASDGSVLDDSKRILEDLINAELIDKARKKE